MKTTLLALFVLLFAFCNLKAQTIPPDTTTYRVLNFRGDTITVRRPPDSVLVPGRLLIHFRRGVLDTSILLRTYYIYFFPGETFTGPPGYTNDLRKLLFDERFCDYETGHSVILDTALNRFLMVNGGHCLRRLTAASPRDTLSIARNGSIVGCDHSDWLVLDIDSMVNPYALGYQLVTLFPQDIVMAYPDYYGGQLLGQPADRFYVTGCEQNSRMIQADTAWNYQTGDSSIIVEVADAGLDYRHPDFGDTLVGAGHKWIATWHYDAFPASPDPWHFNVTDHGTAMAGIIGACSNNIIPPPTPADSSVAGIAGGHGSLPPDTINKGRGVTLGAYVSDIQYGTIGWLGSIFESSAKSLHTPYGMGANIINHSEGWLYVKGGSVPPSEAIRTGLNYAFENGVVFVSAIFHLDSGIEENDTFASYPNGYEEPWVFSIGGSTIVPLKEKLHQSNFGYGMDLIAPSGGEPFLPCGNPFALNWTTRRQDTTTPFKYGNYGGTSASAANVSGASALLLSKFVDTSSGHFWPAPEDVQLILKASAWREDTERSMHPPYQHSWRPKTGYGHLDIGNAFKMMDTDLVRSPRGGYSLFHRFAHGLPLLDTGAWSTDTSIYDFTPPWSYMRYGDSLAPRLYFLPRAPFGYAARHRVLTYNDTLDLAFENSDTCPLFACGRSGEKPAADTSLTVPSPSGWSFAQAPNYETGWTEVTNGHGAGGLQEGIFVKPANIVSVRTVQYDVYAYNGSKIGAPLGHFPNDSLIGVNYTVFGRLKHGVDDVNPGAQTLGDSLSAAISFQHDDLAVRYQLLTNRPVTVTVQDVLGRIFGVFHAEHPYLGANYANLHMPAIASGIYFCTISQPQTRVVKEFVIQK